ncbi:MAG: hypothetical protein ABIQ31_27040 [Ferruginibacter sp.]
MMFEDRIKQNAYLYFASRLLLLLLIVFVLDFSIGKILRYYYFKQETGRQYRATYAIDKTTADVLIFGSSRAYHHYVPDIIETNLKQSCYNTGSPGQYLLYNYATLRAILKRYAPKMIILDLSTSEFQVGRDSYDRLSFLLPYYKDHEEIRPIVDLKSRWEKFKLLSSIYAFNSSFLMIAGGNSEYFKKRTTDLKGYKPLTGVWQKPITPEIFQDYKLDSVKVSMLTSFIDDCNRAGTKLFIVSSPIYVTYRERDPSMVLIDKVAKEKKVPFMDFSYDTSFTNHPFLFNDPSHLNEKGAKLFTAKVTGMIKDSVAAR